MKYNWIIFDADGTLYDYDAAERYALTSAFAEFSMDISDNVVKSYRIINEALFKQFETGDVSMSELRTRRFSLLFNELGLEPDISSFSDIYLNHLSSGSQLLPDAETVVKSLSELCDLVILTNGIASVQRSRFERSPISQYFKDIVISEEEGFSKPSKEIFDITFKRIGSPSKENVLMVGDSLTSDIAGGNNYGIDTCWISKDEASANKPDSTYKITQLKELSKILGVA